MNKPSDYKHIAAWGNMMGSFQYYVDAQQKKAAEMNAPLNTVYFDDNNRPVTMDEVKSPLSIYSVNNYLSQKK